MADGYRRAVEDLVARCEKLGWEVRESKKLGLKRAGWKYMILCDNDPQKRVFVYDRPPRHGDTQTSIENLARDLKRHGFVEAEKRQRAQREAAKVAQLAADREKADMQAEAIADRARAAADAVERTDPTMTPAIVVVEEDEPAGELADEAQPVSYEWISTPTRIKETRTVILTPEMCRKILDTMNTHNRPEKPNGVKKFERILQAGRFRTNHQGIAVDWNGVLQDGQCRMRACVNTGIPIQIEISVGRDPENFDSIDSPTVRSGADTAYVLGEEHPSIIAPAARMLLSVRLYGERAHRPPRGSKFDNEMLRDTIKEFGDPLRDAVRYAKATNETMRRFNAPGLAVAAFLLHERVPDDPRVREFLDAIPAAPANGKGTIAALARAIQNGSTGGRAHTAWPTAAMVIKAWNADITGKTHSVMSFRPKDETFPVVFLPPQLSAPFGALAVDEVPAPVRPVSGPPSATFVAPPPVDEDEG